MTSQNDQFYSTTTIYVNAEQFPDHQMSSQLNSPVNNLYQNISEQDDVRTCNSDSLNSLTNSVGQLQPPVPAPRVSLLRQKLKQRHEDGSALEKKLDQIDENLNLILKQHVEKFRLEDSVINQDFSRSANHKHPLFASHESDLYISNDPLQQESNGLNRLNQFASQLSNKRDSELNRNTYISNSDVNERFSNAYNELDEPIYSDIIFDESKRRSNGESLYDSPTDSIKFINLRPPPLPPPRPKQFEATGDSSNEIESSPRNDTRNDIRIEIDEARNELNDEEQGDASNLQINLHSTNLHSTNIQNDLKNELRNHFKTDLFRCSPSALNNSSSLNSSLNNGQFKAYSTNPFLTPHSSSDLKLNELKESLSLMRKDHLSTLNGGHKKESTPKLNKDDLLLLERQLEGFSSTTATNFSTKSSLVSIGMFFQNFRNF